MARLFLFLAQCELRSTNIPNRLYSVRTAFRYSGGGQCGSTRLRYQFTCHKVGHAARTAHMKSTYTCGLEDNSKSIQSTAKELDLKYVGQATCLHSTYSRPSAVEGHLVLRKSKWRHYLGQSFVCWFVCFPLSASLLFSLSFFVSFYLALPLFLSCPYFLLHSSNFVPLWSSLFLSLITFWLIYSFPVSRVISLIIQCSFHLSFFCPLFLSSLLYFLPNYFLGLSLPTSSLFVSFQSIIWRSIHTLHFAHFFFLNPLPCLLFPSIFLFFFTFLSSISSFFSLHNIFLPFFPQPRSNLASSRSAPRIATNGHRYTPIHTGSARPRTPARSTLYLGLYRSLKMINEAAAYR